MVHPVEVTDANFASEVEAQQGLVVVDCWAAWCGPCRVLSPVVDALAAEYEGRAKFGKLDIDVNSAIPQRFNVRSIPTLLYFVNGELVDRTVGALPKLVLGMKVEEHLGALAAR
ncbi:MAG: thioredoxin [Gemmatimonadota bacterium]|nr:thioredoxin [Gemmatimonadota bacterium]MDE3126425.1 thioredoxin [Gemmatimonadota bacterium]MDE3173814.1 thioredoxin [Gemmatimonadota bacterium]